MIVGEQSTSPPGRWFRGAGSGVLLCGLTSVVATAAIGRAWAACDVGSNAAANSMNLLFLAPLVWIAAAVPWVLLRSTLGKRHHRSALTAGLAFTIWFAWFSSPAQRHQPT